MPGMGKNVRAFVPHVERCVRACATEKSEWSCEFFFLCEYVFMWYLFGIILFSSNLLKVHIQTQEHTDTRTDGHI